MVVVLLLEQPILLSDTNGQQNIATSRFLIDRLATSAAAGTARFQFRHYDSGKCQKVSQVQLGDAVHHVSVDGVVIAQLLPDPCHTPFCQYPITVRREICLFKQLRVDFR